MTELSKVDLIEVGIETMLNLLGTEEQQQLSERLASRFGWQRVGALAIATEVEAPASFRDQLLATVTEGAELYIKTINGINTKRDKKDRIPILRHGEYRERAQDWLTDNLVIAATHLPATDNRPRLIMPRLNRSITRAENVEAWAAASDRGLWPWKDRMKFLQNWSQDELSGFDPNADPDQVQFQVIPTAYDQAREGTVKKQLDNLETLQTEVPELDVTAIFDGAMLARRYKGQDRRWQDSYVRGIKLEPTQVDGSGYVPVAYVYDGGDASVFVSDVQFDYAARLLAR